MKRILSFLVIYTAQLAFGSHNPDTLEGIWTADGPNKMEVSFCDGVATWKLVIEDGTFVPIEIPYKIVGGNSGLFILEYQPPGAEAYVLNVRTTEGGITIEDMDCKSSPETCKAGVIASYRALSIQHPDVDVERMIQAFSDFDFSTMKMQSKNYVYARECQSQTQ